MITLNSFMALMPGYDLHLPGADSLLRVIEPYNFDTKCVLFDQIYYDRLGRIRSLGHKNLSFYAVKDASLWGGCS